MESGGNKETYNALIAAACNGVRFGGGIKICPDAKIDDRKLDVVIVDCINKRQILKAFTYLMRGKITSYHAAKHFTAEKVKFIPNPACTVQLDGELYDGLEFTAEIKEGPQFYRP